eukprot:2267011-Rhodomonas_salina.1
MPDLPSLSPYPILLPYPSTVSCPTFLPYPPTLPPTILLPDLPTLSSYPILLPYPPTLSFYRIMPYLPAPVLSCGMAVQEVERIVAKELVKAMGMVVQPYAVDKMVPVD